MNLLEVKQHVRNLFFYEAKLVMKLQSAIPESKLLEYSVLMVFILYWIIGAICGIQFEHFYISSIVAFVSSYVAFFYIDDYKGIIIISLIIFVLFYLFSTYLTYCIALFISFPIAKYILTKMVGVGNDITILTISIFTVLISFIVYWFLTYFFIVIFSFFNFTSLGIAEIIYTKGIKLEDLDKELDAEVSVEKFIYVNTGKCLLFIALYLVGIVIQIYLYRSQKIIK